MGTLLSRADLWECQRLVELAGRLGHHSDRRAGVDVQPAVVDEEVVDDCVKIRVIDYLQGPVAEYERVL